MVYLAVNHCLLTRKDVLLRLCLTLMILASCLFFSNVSAAHAAEKAPPKGLTPLQAQIYQLCLREFNPSKALEKARWYAPRIRAASREHKLPATVVAAIIWHESNYKPHLVSPVGARGLMQVMPFHFRRGENWRDPATNLKVGCRVFASYYRRAQGNTKLALMMYNAGPHGAVSRGWGRRYAEAVIQSSRR